MSLAATVTADGIQAPTFEDILASNQGMMRGIYGADIYIDSDSQDGQFISVWSVALNDVNNMAKAVYAAFSPASAQGVGLSNGVKLNGIRRLIASNSTDDVLCVGEQGTDLSGLIIGDNLGLNTRWQLPGLPGSATVVIPDAGQITVTATCLVAGAVAAAAGSLTNIITPTRGWQSVTNPDDAAPGNPIEVDGTLRQRQSQSTAYPALSVLGGIWAAIGNIEGVTRFTIEENDTAAPDGNGVPSHSIAAIVQGGDVDAIAAAISLKKGPGAGTYGTTTVTVPDPAGVGVAQTIKFYRLSVMQVSMLVYLTPLTGYVSPTAALIKGAISYFLSNLAIGETSYLNRLWSPANLMGDAAGKSSGLSDADRDAISNTYNVTALYQARSDMVATGGPYAAGVNVIAVQNPVDFVNGLKAAITLDNGTILKTSITGVAGSNITFANNIPGGRTVQTGALIYVAGDLSAHFTEAFAGTAANMQVVTP